MAIIDSRPFGGTRALRGCDPKKVLVGVADVFDWARRMQGRGVAGGNPEIDWPALMRFKKSFTVPVPESRQTGYDKAGIEVRLNRPLAIRAAGLKADDLREMISAYPTNASDIVHLLN